MYCIKTDFIPVKGQYDVYMDQEKVDGLYADGSVNLEFVNERMTKLPHTGSSMSLVCVIVGAYLMLRRNHEKKKLNLYRTIDVGNGHKSSERKRNKCFRCAWDGKF